MTSHDGAHTYDRGKIPRSAAEAEDELREAREELARAAEYHERELADVRAERDHWKANHDNAILLRRLFTARNDLPPDRVVLAEQINRLEAERDEAQAQVAAVTNAYDLDASPGYKIALLDALKSLRTWQESHAKAKAERDALIAAAKGMAKELRDEQRRADAAIAERDALKEDLRKAEMDINHVVDDYQDISSTYFADMERLAKRLGVEWPKNDEGVPVVSVDPIIAALAAGNGPKGGS